MDATLVGWLDQVARTTLFVAVALFALVNAVALVGFLVTRDRGIVNRWTGRVLAVDLLLVGAGVGVPLVATMTRLTITTVAASVRSVGIGGVAAVETATYQSTRP